MPRYVLHGGAPTYYGELVRTTTELLTALSDSLVNGGWTIINNQIATNSLFLARGKTSNNHYCWAKIRVINNPGVTNGKLLCFQGDLDGTDTNLTPDEHQLTFLETADNRLWVVASDDAMAVCVKGFGTFSSGVSIGFASRVQDSDQYCWYVDNIFISISKTFVAKSAFNSSIWRRLSNDYYNSTDFGASGQCLPYQGIFDPGVVGFPYQSYNDTNNQNAGYLAYQGGIVARDSNSNNDYYEIGERFFVEGRGSVSNYISSGNSMPNPLYFRGKIQHVVNGLSNLPGQTIVQDSLNGVYLSVGGLGHQGIVLVEPTIPTSILTPAFYNGGTNEPGVIFTSGSDLLTKIKTQLLTANWVITDQISSNNLILAEGTTTNNHKCWVQLRVVADSAVSNGFILKIRGDLNGGGTDYSPDNIDHKFTNGAQNKLWLTYDMDSFLIATAQFNDSDMTLSHAGFPDRRNINNPFEWMVGQINTFFNKAYIAKSPHNNIVWRNVWSDFNSSIGQSNTCLPVEGVSDRYTTCLKGRSDIVNYSHRGNDPFNAGFASDRGAVNALNNLPVIGSYFYKVGRGAANAYGSAAAPIKTYRIGDIKYAVTGLASLPALSTATLGTKKYITGDIGWQGMRIK